jgi:hypothetical protein
LGLQAALPLHSISAQEMDIYKVSCKMAHQYFGHGKKGKKGIEDGTNIENWHLEFMGAGILKSRP